MNLEDMLCDACLYKVESNDGEVLIKDLCKRCQKKILTDLLEVASEVSRVDTDAFDEVD